jgi:hypothetical protein
MDDNFYIPDLFSFSDFYTGPSQSSTFPSLEGIGQRDQAADPQLTTDAYWTDDMQDWSSCAYESTFHHPFPAPLQMNYPTAAPQGVGGFG